MNEFLKKIAVIVPAYNEQESIAAVVETILHTQINNIQLVPIVVNDCSKDQTASIVSKLDCILLNLPVNLGIGGAMQTGFKYAQAHQFDYAIQVDGDGQHPASEIHKLLEVMQTGKYNVVIGSRFIEKSGFQSTGMRRLGINFLKNWIRLFTGFTVNDNTSGFRLFDKNVLAYVANHYPDEYPEPESLIMFSKLGYRIKEVAVEMKERQGGESSIKAFNQLYYMIKVSLAIFYSYLKTKK
jgi:hypothetical protein